jgi:hypothetical protein
VAKVKAIEGAALALLCLGGDCVLRGCEDSFSAKTVEDDCCKGAGCSRVVKIRVHIL